MVYHPDPSTVGDLRVWRRTFWRYFHLRPECIQRSPGTLAMAETATIDCVRKQSKKDFETPEVFDDVVNTAYELLLDVFRAGLGGGPSISAGSGAATSSSGAAGSGAASSSSGAAASTGRLAR